MSRLFGKTILLAAILATGAGCATSDEAKGVTYSLTAKQNYEKGLGELKNENILEFSRVYGRSRRRSRSPKPLAH